MPRVGVYGGRVGGASLVGGFGTSLVRLELDTPGMGGDPLQRDRERLAPGEVL